MICNPFDVVEVPFPFVDSPKTKTRKALVLSFKNFNESNNATTLAMITSATNSAWEKDTPVSNLKLAGLKKSCCIRFKLFTIQNNLIKSKVGSLSEEDQKLVSQRLSEIFPLV
jgi:mRNA interferase MazF